MRGNATTFVLRLASIAAVACCIAVPAIGGGFSPSATMRGASAQFSARIESALAPSFSEPAAPIFAAIKSERPRVGADTNADPLSPVFDVATGGGATLESKSGRLLASVVLPAPESAVSVVVQSARHIRSVSIDAVLFVESLASDGAKIELKAPFAWPLAQAIENDLIPDREHHLQVVASASGIKTRLNGRLIAEHDTSQVSDRAAALVALEFLGIKGEIRDLSVTRERVLEDGRMRATLLASNPADLSAAQVQIADAMEPDEADAKIADATSDQNAAEPTAPDTDAASSADAKETESQTDADLLALDDSIGDETQINSATDTDVQTGDDSDALALDITNPDSTVTAGEPEAVAGSEASAIESKSLEKGLKTGKKDDTPSLGLFEMAGLDEASFEVKAEAANTGVDKEQLASAESGPAAPIDGVQEPDDAPRSPPDYEGAPEDASTDSSDVNQSLADQTQESEQSILNTDEQIAQNDQQYGNENFNDGNFNEGGINESIFPDSNLPQSYEPENIGSGTYEPLTNQDPLLAAIQNQQEQALLAQQMGNQALDESHSPSEPELSEEEKEDDQAALDDDDAVLVDQSTGVNAGAQPSFTDTNNTEDSTDTVSDNSSGTSNPTPVIPSVPGFGLPRPQSPLQPAVTNFFAFDPSTSPDVIAWYRLDGSLGDIRGVLAPLSSRGTSFDSDSFEVPREPGNQRVQVEDSGDQLLGSVDVQLLNFVGVTQRISISAMIFVNEWQSSFLSSPTILQFGANSGPGIELIDSSQGRQILGAGDVVFDSGTVDAVLTEQSWHHVRIDLTSQGYELRINGSVIGQVQAPDDLAAWDAISTATVRVGNFDGFIDELIVMSTNTPAVTTTSGTTDGSGTSPTTTPGSGDDGSDPSVSDPVDESVILVSYPLSANFNDATANAPELEVSGNVQFSVATPTRTTGALATTSFTQEGDELYAPLPFDNLITEPLEKLIFEAEFRLNDWDAGGNVPILQIVAEGNAWFSFAWDPTIGPDMAAAEQPLAEGETLQRIFEDGDWHKISFVMTPEECSVRIDERIISTVPCVDAIKGWPAPNTELVLGNFNGYIRSVEIRAIEEN